MLAGFGGQAAAAAMSLAVVPVYVRWLGMESFGIVGFYLTCRGLLRLLDLGLTPATGREIARLAVRPGRARRLRDFVRTFELVFLLAAAAVSLLMLWAAPGLSRYWLRADTFPAERLTRILGLVGILCGLQWPISYYHGALMGLERQVAYNGMKALESLANYGGGVLVLALLGARVEVLFVWQILVGTVFAASLARVTWRSLPAAPGRPRVRWLHVGRLWRFAAGMTAISATSMVLVHADRAILSHTAGLEELGHYSLAVFIAGAIVTLVVTPIFNAVFPRLSSLVAAERPEEVVGTYRLSNQCMAVAVVPAAAMIAAFAAPLVGCWVGDPETAARVAPMLALYVAGTALNALMNPPYALQLATGNTRIGVWINSALIVLFVPLAAVLVPRFGGVACAAIWTLLMAVYVILGVPWTAAACLPRGHRGTWFRDVAPVVLISAVVAAAARVFLPPGTSAVSTLGVAAGAWGLAVLLTMRCVPGPGRLLAEVFPKIAGEAPHR